MNPLTLGEAKMFFSATKTFATKEKNAEVVACVPAPYLGAFGGSAAKGALRLGAQDVSVYSDGAHTGGYSARMLANLGVKYVILGHSERRAEGETSAQVAEKIKLVLSEGMVPIVCVGESERKDDGKYFHEIEHMLRDSLGKLSPKLIEHVVIAYEPVWAIGKKALREATPAECMEVVLFIKKVLADKYSLKKKACAILFGGSVNEKMPICL